jgi:glyoxylase-like metal-dependent hydrolase (beta-lactamase superfamily II)
MTSSRNLLSKAFGIAFVSATTWPIRADQARSTQGQSNTSRSKAGRTTRTTSLRWDVFLAPKHTCRHERFASRRKSAAVATDFVNPYFWGAGRCAGHTPITVEQARALANWVAASGKNLTTIYATHGHGDHFFGTSTVLERFPGARFVARPDVIKIMREQASPESLATFWNPRFPDQISGRLAIAEELTGNVIDLEGEDLVSVPLGFTDTASTTCLHVPSIGLVVAGDAAYNGVHLHLSESPDQQNRQQWIAALDKMDSLRPRAVIAGHKRVGNDDSPKILGETRRYIRDFERFAMQTTTARELYDQMLTLYPDWGNRGALWSSVSAIKA